MRRCAVEVEVVLLHVLAVIAFAVGQSEEPLLENRVPGVPEGQAEAEVLAVIGNASDPVLTPAVGARPGMIMREEIPGVPVFAVVLAHGAPLSLREVRSPLFPGDGPGAGFLEPTVFIVRHISLFRPL